MTIQELRCEALRRAIEARVPSDSDNAIVKRAVSFENFLTGKEASPATEPAVG